MKDYLIPENLLPKGVYRDCRENSETLTWQLLEITRLNRP